MWAWWGSNPRPRDYESPALTTELQARMDLTLQNSKRGNESRDKPPLFKGGFLLRGWGSNPRPAD